MIFQNITYSEGAKTGGKFFHRLSSPGDNFPPLRAPVRSSPMSPGFLLSCPFTSFIAENLLRLFFLGPLGSLWTYKQTSATESRFNKLATHHIPYSG